METEPAHPLTVCEFQRPTAAEGFDASIKTYWPDGSSTCDWLFLRNRNDTLFSACPDAHRQITLVGLGEGERGSCGVSFKGFLFQWMPGGGQSAWADRGWHQELVLGQGGWHTLSHACQALRLAQNKSSGKEPWQEVLIFFVVLFMSCAGDLLLKDCISFEAN